MEGHPLFSPPNVSPGPAPLILLPPTSGFHKEAIVSEPIVAGWGDAYIGEDPIECALRPS